MEKGVESWLCPRQLVVTGDPTIQEHENCEFTPSLESHLASQGFFFLS